MAKEIVERDRETGKLVEIKQILMPKGGMRTYYRGENQTWDQIIRDVVLKECESYCYENWLSSNHEDVYCAERRVKAFLDRCAQLIVKGSKGIESEYKSMVHTVREVPVSECNAEVSDLLYSERQAPAEMENDGHYNYVVDRLEELDKRRKPKTVKKRVKTKFDRLQEIDKAFPGSTKTWCSVDAKNRFTYNGQRYVVPRELPGYWGEAVMDRILVVENERSLRFYDQDVRNMFVAA